MKKFLIFRCTSLIEKVADLQHIPMHHMWAVKFKHRSSKVEIYFFKREIECHNMLFTGDHLSPAAAANELLAKISKSSHIKLLENVGFIGIIGTDCKTIVEDCIAKASQKLQRIVHNVIISKDHLMDFDMEQFLQLESAKIETVKAPTHARVLRDRTVLQRHEIVDLTAEEKELEVAEDSDGQSCCEEIFWDLTTSEIREEVNDFGSRSLSSFYNDSRKFIDDGWDEQDSFTKKGTTIMDLDDKFFEWLQSLDPKAIPDSHEFDENKLDEFVEDQRRLGNELKPRKIRNINDCYQPPPQVERSKVSLNLANDNSLISSAPKLGRGLSDTEPIIFDAPKTTVPITSRLFEHAEIASYDKRRAERLKRERDVRMTQTQTVHEISEAEITEQIKRPIMFSSSSKIAKSSDHNPNHTQSESAVSRALPGPSSRRQIHNSSYTEQSHINMSRQEKIFSKLQIPTSRLSFSPAPVQMSPNRPASQIMPESISSFINLKRGSSFNCSKPTEPLNISDDDDDEDDDCIVMKTNDENNNGNKKRKPLYNPPARIETPNYKQSYKFFPSKNRERPDFNSSTGGQKKVPKFSD